MSFKRSQKTCTDLEDELQECNTLTDEDCSEATIGCERTCCEKLGLNCRTSIDLTSVEKCEKKKIMGLCNVVQDECAFTCCGISDVPAKLQIEELNEIEDDDYEIEDDDYGDDTNDDMGICEDLEDLEPSIECFHRAFKRRNCRSDFWTDACAFSCCVAEVDDDNEEDDLNFIGEVRALKEKSSDKSTSTTENACLEFEDKDSNKCVRQYLKDTSKCDDEEFSENCAYTCCIVDPSPCLELEDEAGYHFCHKKVLSDECQKPGIYSKCQFSCCEYHGVQSSTTEESAATTTEVTEESEETTTGTSTEEPDFELCGEFSDENTAERCTRRVNRGNCEESLEDENKCQYSCCMELFKTSSTSASSSSEAPTTAPDDGGLSECQHLSDIGSPSGGNSVSFCAAVIDEGGCDKFEKRKCCEFTCCANDYVRDKESGEGNDPENEKCDEDVNPDTKSYPECLEMYTRGLCDSDDSFGCDTTCCLWRDSFKGSECMMFENLLSAETCALQCPGCFVDILDFLSMCSIFCERRFCYTCKGPDRWDPNEDNECSTLSNEDSSSECLEHRLNEGCEQKENDGSGFYDTKCNLECCVRYSGTISTKRTVNLTQLLLKTKQDKSADELSESTSRHIRDVEPRSKDEYQTLNAIVDDNKQSESNHASSEPCFDMEKLQFDPDCESRRARRSPIYNHAGGFIGKFTEHNLTDRYGSENNMAVVNSNVTVERNRTDSTSLNATEDRNASEPTLNGTEDRNASEPKTYKVAPRAQNLMQAMGTEFQLEPSMFFICVLVVIKICLY